MAGLTDATDASVDGGAAFRQLLVQEFLTFVTRVLRLDVDVAFAFALRRCWRRRPRAVYATGWRASILLLFQFVGFNQLSRNPSFAQKVLRPKNLSSPFHWPGSFGVERLLKSVSQAAVASGIVGDHCREILWDVFPTCRTSYEGLNRAGCGLAIPHGCEIFRVCRRELCCGVSVPCGAYAAGGIVLRICEAILWQAGCNGVFLAM